MCQRRRTIEGSVDSATELRERRLANVRFYVLIYLCWQRILKVLARFRVKLKISSTPSIECKSDYLDFLISTFISDS